MWCKRLINVVSSLLVLLSLSSTTAMAAKLYKWFDADGNVYYSDQIPPDASRERHQLLNQRGVVTKSVQAAKTPEELAEAARQAKLLEEQQKVALALQQRDRMLLDTFSTERDLILARDDRVTSIESGITLTEKLIEQLEEKRVSLETEIESITGQGQEVPVNIDEQYKRVQSDLQTHSTSLDKRRVEKEKQITQFAANLERYRELKILRE